MTEPFWKSQRSCGLKIRYSFRCFRSRQVALILIWILLTTTAHRMLYELLVALYSEEKALVVVSATSVCIFVAVPFFGWLADAQLGNYKVVKIGITVSLISSVMVSLFSLLRYNTSLSSHENLAWRIIFHMIICLFYWAATVTVLMNSFQLSLEQMPDASAANITSFISWYILSIVIGFWVGEVIKDMLFACVNFNLSDLKQVLSLLPVILTSVNFILFHFISPKWLIIEPKSPQSLKNIYRILKFAAKHKAPVNRSALTYWEEDIPSRLDLGKSRYGGPFTTEQVEDVKTFFRILAVSVGIFLTMFAFGIQEYDPFSTKVFNTTNVSQCMATGLFLFTLHPFWCGILAVLVYEFLLYPCLNYVLPNSMKRIGLASFIVLLRNLTFLTMYILNVLERDTPWVMGINSALDGLLLVKMAIPSLEFVCAQAPYNMRGLISGYMQFVFWLGYILGYAFIFKFFHYFPVPSSSLVSVSVGAATSVFAFLVYLIVACWYKRRVRDDIDTPHKWVEDVYDRYLSAAINN